MADSDKNILITPAKGATSEPTVVFTGKDNTPITLRVLDNGTVSFEGTSGQLFSVTNSLTGTIFSVNDISGMPSLEILDNGTIRLAQYSGNIAMGKATPDYKLDVVGTIKASSGMTTSGTISSVDGSPKLILLETGGSAGSATFGVSGLYPTLGTRDQSYTLLIDGRAVPVIDTGGATPNVGGRTGMQWITGGVIRQYNGSAWVPLAVPSGGTAGQILAKSSSTNYDAAWVEGNVVRSSTVTRIVTLTQAEYDALIPDANTLYIIT